MENRTTTISQDANNGLNVNRNFFLNDIPVEVFQRNPVLDRLASEGHQSFIDYVEWSGRGNDPNLIVLSASHHYYYDAEDLKEVTTVLNLKQLNHIKQMKEFINTISSLIPHKSYFVGSFIDRKIQYGFFPASKTSQFQPEGSVDQIENGIVSRIPLVNLMYNIMDSRTNRNLTKKTVISLLESSNLKVLDMSEIQGLTYFCTQKIKTIPIYE